MEKRRINLDEFRKIKLLNRLLLYKQFFLVFCSILLEIFFSKKDLKSLELKDTCAFS